MVGRGARAVSAQRAAWRRSGAFDLLGNPERASFVGGVFQGTVRMPIFLALYSNTDSTALVANVPRTSLESRLLGTAAAPPYTLSTYYDEISDTRLAVTGDVFEWKRVTQTDAFYEGGGTCQGLCGSSGVGNLISELVVAWDGSTDFGIYDNDGPDGVPNSGDDDGFVDAVVIMHPELDGACGGTTTNVWAHRFVVAGWGVNITTNDASANGGSIRVSDYIIQGGQGGDGGCSVNLPQAPGVVAHETGHLFGLPDLYATGSNGEGIGEWGLMGSGNYQTAISPAYMEAWSRSELGWVTEVAMTTDSTVALSPVETSDSVLLVQTGRNGEYFLIENRQALGSDAQINGVGLLIWHVDSALIASRSGPVNNGTPYALAPEQADGLNHLQNGANRGDAADPFPGSGNKIRWSYNTIPSSARNDGVQTWVTFDSITQLSANGPVQFKLELGVSSSINVSAVGPSFRLDGATVTSFLGLFTPGSMHTLDMDSPQTSGGTRWTWQSWSNGMARSHTFTASPGGDSITATVSTQHQIAVTVAGQGAVSSSTGDDLSAGVFYDGGTVITLTPAPLAGNVFENWAEGAVTDTVTVRNITLSAPTTLTATFNPDLVAPDPASGAATLTPIMGAAFNHQFTATGGTGSYGWALDSGTLPLGLTLTVAGGIVGTPTATGAATVTASVTSGRQTQTSTFTFNVSAPQLVTADVVGFLLGAGAALSADDLNYLDLLGNNNGSFDLGDFLAWVQATGATPTADEMAAIFARTGGDR